jgi:hypothetical protein
MTQDAGHPAPPPQSPWPGWMPPQRTKAPKVLWWVGGVLMVLAVVVLTVLLVATIHQVRDLVHAGHQTDYPADGKVHRVDATPGQQQLLVTDDGASCMVRDRSTGAPIRVDLGLGGSFGGYGGNDDTSLAHFDPGSGHLAIACPGPGRWWLVPQSRMTDTIVLAIAMVIGAGALGVAGVVVLIIALVLTLRRPRQPVWMPPSS